MVKGRQDVSRRRTPGLKLVLLLCGIGLSFLHTARPGAAGVDVRAEFDKKFDFGKVRTWAWNPAGAGEVKMARTPDDDQEVVRKRAAPIIKESVAAELASRKLQLSDANPDLRLTYYLLLTIGTSAQTLGQFLPPVAEWGLPPFTPQTQSLTVAERGSLVLDLSSDGRVVWRGIAQAKIKWEDDSARREALLREAVRDLLKRFPPRG
ncbi:MAG: DUF4136 domain-containing protein [Acidobacteria bacterium]|nr:MAG: DUF4136 domain-containing protein [Acidobacteriota bacterium]